MNEVLVTSFSAATLEPNISMVHATRHAPSSLAGPHQRCARLIHVFCKDMCVADFLFFPFTFAQLTAIDV